MLVVDDDLGLQDLTLTTWRRKILSLARHRQLNGSPLGGDFPEGLYDVVRLVARNGEHRRRHYRRVYAFRARVIWAGGVVDDVTRVAGSSLGPVGGNIGRPKSERRRRAGSVSSWESEELDERPHTLFLTAGRKSLGSC